MRGNVRYVIKVVEGQRTERRAVPEKLLDFMPVITRAEDTTNTQVSFGFSVPKGPRMMLDATAVPAALKLAVAWQNEGEEAEAEAEDGSAGDDEDEDELDFEFDDYVQVSDDENSFGSGKSSASNSSRR